MTKNTLQIALLIDGDNAQPSLIPPILEALDKHGRCVMQRVYGDFMAENMSAWRKIEEIHAIQLVQQSRRAAGKNVTDIALTVDAMDFLHSGIVNAFCIVSSDSDYTPLVMRLKEKAATVIGVGKPTTPQSFKNACSVFISTDTLQQALKQPVQAEPPKPSEPKVVQTKVTPPKAVQPKTGTKSSSPTKPPNARPILIAAYEASNKTEGWVALTDLGQSLRTHNSQFKPSTYGSSTLSKLVALYPDVFEIRTKKGTGNNSRTYVRLKKPN